jgi:glycosyltransferase involved in cell wall biosynthesis
LSRLSYRGTWEVLVVDNNSSDDTRERVRQSQGDFPVPLRYLFAPQPGKYWGMNTGIGAAHGTFIAATDDDAFPEADWLDRAADGFARHGCDFVGGPVYPLWQAPTPSWLNANTPIVGKVLGLQDYGPEPREYGGPGIAWPIGVNVAYRRDVFARAGLFDGRLGRVAGTLRNQAQREWHLRARAAGARGMYLPAMIVRHRVDTERLTRRYFHRWFYWHGISRAILYETSGLHLLEPDGNARHTSERHLCGVPASVWTTGARASVSAAARWVTGRPSDAFEYELHVCFCAGVIRQCLNVASAIRRQRPIAVALADTSQVASDRRRS